MFTTVRNSDFAHYLSNYFIHSTYTKKEKKKVNKMIFPENANMLTKVFKKLKEESRAIFFVRCLPPCFNA